MKVHESDARLIFAALDSSGNGEVSYQEFCELSEERRLKIDPFDREPKNQ
jgi:Ca2+-binding EF-hand superfamily protein